MDFFSSPAITRYLWLVNLPNSVATFATWPQALESRACKNL